MSAKKPKLKLVEQLMRPQRDAGVDWSRPRVVLARIGTRELWWMGGGKCWAGRQANYASAELRAIDLSSRSSSLGKEVFEGGRLTQARLDRAKDEIEKFFGIPDLVHSLDVRRTLLEEGAEVPPEMKPVVRKKSKPVAKDKPAGEYVWAVSVSRITKVPEVLQCIWIKNTAAGVLVKSFGSQRKLDRSQYRICYSLGEVKQAFSDAWKEAADRCDRKQAELLEEQKRLDGIRTELFDLGVRLEQGEVPLESAPFWDDERPRSALRLN